MFVSQERRTARKPFQKPNILRRKPKTTKRNTENDNESSELSAINNSFGLVSLPMVQTKELHSQSPQFSEAPSFRVISVDEWRDDQKSASQTLDINGDSLTIYAHDAQVDDNDISTAQSTLNVESFLNNGSTTTKGKILFNIDDASVEIPETETEQKWCLDFGSEDSKEITNYYDGSQISSIYIDKNSILCTDAVNEPLTQTSHSEANITLGGEPAQINLANTTVKFMCDVPNCKKSFWTEARLQKHKNVHNKPKSFPVLHCPVKTTDAEGIETQCHRTFQIRNQLMKHLDDDHSPEDALYKCTKCGRRFYWACGARMHQANGCARTYTCAWAGCGRVFRQQCRLREHARAHTGDRPYPCHYPGCGWAFRSASKLMRHARRHTGERQHTCGACGHAFPRREHLREHVARHFAHATTLATTTTPATTPAPTLSPTTTLTTTITPALTTAPVLTPAPSTPLRTCTHTGCERTFSTTSSLYAHVKKFHKDGDAPQQPKKQKRPKKDMFLFQLSTPTAKVGPTEASVEAIPESSVETCVQPCAEAERDVELEGRCARTHCTWPLRPRDAHYALEEHAQVEQSESCESNIYTVRSDLFLHGNLLINEDSEFIISRAAGGTEGAAEGALGLIDTHPTGDLTQEELMYADAVDESSFRVFLLNGEELA